MDYKKLYDNLIKTRFDRPLELNGYYEKHHIIPKCLGGLNDSNNLIKLTYREHFLAHWLLCKIHKNEAKIHYAFLCMLRKQPTGERILTSRQYDIIKKNFTEFKKWHIKIFNPGKTEKSRESARKRMLEKNPISLNPEKNRTAQPIKVYYENGDIKDFSYAKKFCIDENVPYASMKYGLRYSGGKSKKHGIIKIERIDK